METIKRILYRKQMYYLMLLFFTAGILRGQEILIPDANFKSKLLEASPSNTIAKDAEGNNIRIDINEDGEIQESEASAVYGLEIYSSGISSLSGIEYFVNLAHLDCSENNLTELDLSSNYNLKYMWVIGNPNLNYVNVKNGSTFEGIGETDWINIWGNLPNYCYVCADDFEVDHIESYLNYFGTQGKHVSPYCTFYPGGSYNTIKGALVFDSNNDGTCNNFDLPRSFLKINTINTTDGLQQNSSFTDEAGNYVFYTQDGTFQLFPHAETVDAFTFSSESNTAEFPLSNNQVEIVNFCVLANGYHPDLEVAVSPLIPPRPGYKAIYKIVYRNKGNQTLSGSVKFQYDESRLDFVSNEPALNGQEEGLLKYDFLNLTPFEKREILVVLNVNTPTGNPGVNVGDILPFLITVNTNQTDDNPEDNVYEFEQTVVDTYDPNDIICVEGDIIGLEDVGKELHYLIRFTNTGIYPSENIVISMEIDPAEYDISSVRILDTSHSAKARVNDNNLEVFFPQARIESGGHGNILLIMKTKENLSEGDFVKSRANIYFDNNYPVRTGDATTFIENLMTSADPDLNDTVSVFPNPVTDKLTISSEDQIKSVELFDMNGMLIRTMLINDNKSVQNLHSLSKGIYILRIRTDKGIIVQKLVKQ